MSDRRTARRRLVFSMIAGLTMSLNALPPAAGQTVPETLGWHEIPGTKLATVCPPNGFGGSPYRFSDNCRYVTEAWNSAVFDRLRNRLIVWGGGHGDYIGNELYGFELNSLRIQRLTDPGLPVTTEGCHETVANGSQANARHTYDGITYLDHVDRMFVFGGSLSWCGFFSRDTWTFNFTSSEWERRKPSGPIPRPVPGIVAVYDASTRKVFLHDDADLYSYEFEGDRFRRLASGNPIGYRMTGVIDPVRRKFVLVGNGRVFVYDIGPRSWHTRQTLNTRGGQPIVDSGYPGLAYDPISDRIVAWNGGDTVYALNLDSGAWETTTYAGGPGKALDNGTNKRWSYSAASGVFVVVNSMHSNVWVLRLTPTGSRAPQPSVPAKP